MAKRKHLVNKSYISAKKRPVSISFVLLRFVLVMLGCMLLCGIGWFAVLGWLRGAGVIYHGSVSNMQVEQLLATAPDRFISPGGDFLPEYVLFDADGQILESNVDEKTQKALAMFLQEDPQDIHISRRTYDDGSTVILRWYYRGEFADPALRHRLPPFEYLWWFTLCAAWVLCLLCSTLWLGRRLAAKLRLFSEVSAKVGAQELDFTVPHAGIREYDQALEAMEHMRRALYTSLSSQWAAQQAREAEIAALAHDLKTPLTLVGGNAELLLDEDLPESSRKMVETIAASNDRAKQYVASLLETSAGTDEPFVSVCLHDVFDQLCQGTEAVAKAGGVCLKIRNGLEGSANVQNDHLLRALGNVVQNAIEHTPAGKNVYVEGGRIPGGWQIVVRDEGPGFSPAALHHAKERLWRGDTARGADGHHGLGLWFAAQVIETHAGQMALANGTAGAVVTIRFLSSGQ